MLDIILDARACLVAGRHRQGHVHRARQEGRRQHRRHRARLRHDADAAPRARGRHQRLDKGQRNALGIVDQAKAIGAFDHHAGFVRDPRQLALVGQPLLAPFRKPGGKDDRSPAPPRRQRADRIEHARTRDREHRDIDIQRQVVDRGQARPACDLAAFGIDQVNRARKPVAVEIGHDRRAERAGLVRRANHHHRPGRQQAAKVTLRRYGHRRGFQIDHRLGAPGFRRAACSRHRRQDPACRSCRR